MKIFKKAISLVLVFAMLASFAGMTGYKYSPMSIEAEAKHFVTPGGVEITMWSTIYKINHDYTMTYPDKVDSSVSHPSEVGDYAIPHFDNENNLSYTLVFPAGTTQFNAGCSIDGVYWTSYGTLTSTENSSYWSSGKAVMNRPGNDAMYWDYGALYRDNLLGKGVKGFRDIGKIKWRVVYTCNGTEYTEYWTVDVLDWDRQSVGNSQIWNGAATSSKPTDSQAGKNALTNIHVPATLYLSGTSVVQSMNSRQGNSRRFDTYLMFTLPSGGYDPKVYQVNINDEVISNQLTFTKLGNSGNTHKWNITGTLPSGTTEAYYRIEYKVDVTDPLGNPDTVTYTQYAASFVKPIPNHNAVWASTVERSKGSGGNTKSRQTFFHEMGFLPALVRNGAEVVMSKSMGTARQTGTVTSIDGSWSHKNFSGSYAVGNIWTDARVTAGFFASDNKHYYFTHCVGIDDYTSNNTIGATIYYDSQAFTVNDDATYNLSSTASTSIGIDVAMQDQKDGANSGQDEFKWSRFDDYYEQWSVATSVNYNGRESGAKLLTAAYTNASYNMASNGNGLNLVTGVAGGTWGPGTIYYYTYTLNNLQSIPSLRAISRFMTCSCNNDNAMIDTVYGWHLDKVSVPRTTPHAFMEEARKNNYVKAEMDATWWDSYRKSVFAAYVNCGNLTAAETISFSTDLSKPVYKFADYSALNTSILTPVEWDRGGKVGSGTEPAAGYLDWGTGYEKWNSKTYATDYGKVPGSLAAYDLVFTEDTEAETMEFKVSSTPRTGAYYYTAATWNAYTAARDYAVEVYNYPNSTVATFDYDTAYPAKAATQEGNQANVGLACYHQAEIDAAVSNLQTKRAALVKYDVNNNNYDIDQYYRKLVNQLGTIAYDNSAKALFDFNTKHGFEGITSEIYDEASIVFRASAPEDVFDYVWTAAESSDPGYLGDGHVKVDEDGNPLYKKEDGTIVLASEAGDVGILEFPREDGTLLPVGRGNTFSQLYFDNSAKSQYAVTSARAALRNRLRWYMGGGGAAGYEYLGMVEGVYNQQGLTEDNLNNNPTQYFWSGKEHQDDILREVYALYRVKTTLRLAANYREVVEALNNENNYIPSYDIGGTAYKEKNLQNETMFQTYTPASAWDTVSITANGATYHTSGKTWYTEDSWAGFIADRNKLAAMIYNGSTRTSTSSPYGDADEIGKEYVYDSGVANKYYTYDVKLSSGASITNTYYTNGYYQTGGHLAAEYQDDINQAVKDYKAWFNGDTTDGKELELKNLDDYTWEAYNETTVSDIEDKVKSLYQEIDIAQTFYDFTSTTDSTNKTASADLDKTKTISLHDPADVTALNALADVVTALHDGGAAGTKFQGSMSLADQHAAFNTALNAFNTKYLEIVDKATPTIVNEDGETVANPNYKPYVDKSSWNDIFTHLTELYGATVDTTTIYDYVELYSNSATVKAAVQTAIQTYNSAVVQDDYNAAVEALYNALNTSATSVEVGTAADAAIAYPKNLTFNVYNYTMSAQAGKNETPSQFTDGSVTELTNQATSAKNKTYNMLETYVSTINADKAAVTALAATEDNGGVLVYTGAVTTYLEQAIAYAEGQLYNENGEVKTTPVTNPADTTDTVNVQLYSEQSVAELKATLTEAKAALEKAKSGEYGWADQIELDKYTYLVYDETAPDTGENKAAYLLVMDIIAGYKAPYTWSTVADGVVTKTDNWGDSANTIYEKGLYGETARLPAMTGMVDAGLQSGPAYYVFLDAQYKDTTVVKKNDDGTTTTTNYKGTVWDGNGNLITTNGVEVGETTFTNWSSYKEYYNQYAQINRNLTIDSQSTIDTLANDIYRTRNALTLSYFPNNGTDFQNARNYYNILEAYLYTTPITRYEVVKDADGNATGVSTWVENVPLYTFPTLSAEQKYPVYEKVTNAEGNDVLDNDTMPVYTPVTDDNGEQTYANSTDSRVILEAYITAYRAKYASSASKEPYDSLSAAEDLYAEINGYTDENNEFHPGLVQTLGITLKKTNDPSLIAGLEDLKENFIAGTWAEVEQDDGTKMWTYTSDLLNKDQIKMLQDDLASAQEQFSADKAVTANFGNEIVSYTNKIFTDTQNPATDLQFAVYMRDEELFNFLDTTIQGSVPFYYGGDGTYEIRLFRETPVNTLKNSIGYDRKGEEYSNSFFGMLDAGTWPLSDGSGSTVGWPTIYEVNGVKWSKGDAQTPASITGYTGTASTHKYTGENAAIVAILEQVGSYSSNYVYAANDSNSNTFNIAPYEWLAKNAITTKESLSVILGDYQKEGTNYPEAYGKIGWYNGDEYATAYDTDDGYGGYYNYEWFTDTSVVDSYKNKTLDVNGILLSDYLELLKHYNIVDYFAYANGYAYMEDPSYTYETILNESGWSPAHIADISTYALPLQVAYDGFANDFYQAICNLQLLPATEAYREVINAYHSLFAEKYTWSDSYNGWDPASGTAGTIYATDGKSSLYTFYNTKDTVFLSKVRNGIIDDTNFNGKPPYGTVYTYTPVYKDENAQYTGNKENQMAKLVVWYESIVNTAIEDAITIDMEEKVYSYGLTSDPSEYDKFISYAFQLELVDYNYALINAIIETLLTGDLGKLQRADTEGGYAKLFGDWDNMPDISSTATSDGKLHNVQYYTDDSLVAFAQVLLSNNVVLQSNGTSTLISQDNAGNNKVITISNWESFKNNTYINSLAQTDADKLVRETLIPALNTLLVLKAADATSIKNAINGTEEQKGATYYTTNKDLFVQDDAWTTFVNALEAAEDALVMCDESVSGYYTALNNQTTVNDIASALFTAMSNLKRKADSASPEISVTVDAVGINNFYEKVSSADGVAILADVDTTGASDPATGTVFMPNNGGYSLLVYTNEVSPRILLQIEDKNQKVGDNDAVIEASKKETISVKSQRTSGTVTNLIYGTMNSKNVILDIKNRNLKTDAQANATTPDSTGPLGSYVNATKDTKDPTKNEAGSSVFAILAPEFNNTNASAAAIYSISVKDVVSQESGVQASGDNYSKSLIVGNATADISETVSSETNMITVYIYYHNSMAKNNDEGIDVKDGMASLATPVVSAAGHVASVLLSGEPNYTGAWRRGIGLTRAFGSAVRSWEFMSQLGSENSIGTVKNVAFDDPTFGEKNLGSFYYVLDSQAAEGTVDAEVIAAYKNGKDSTAGLMDYDRATEAKTEMITQINAMSDDALNTFKASKNFNLYGGTDTAGNYINYAQVLTDKVEMGDLVFIHVVDRWGNVVNRIVEITNLDKIIPVVKATEGVSGQVTITEEGGSGIKDITVHNGDFSLGDVDYKIDSTQNVTFTENVVDYVNVVTANNQLTLSKLVPGKTYYIGTVDNAGNSSSTGVKANANGEIALTVTNTTASAETTEEGSVASNSSTFTLNGTDMITINAGEASSIIDASLEGNVFANRAIRHYVTTKDTVTAIKTVYQDGTVEEWTPDDVTVKDNGDGTLRWLIPRTLTPGEHSYKLYAKVDGEYETFYAPATITATNRTIRFTYTIAGMGRTVLKYSGSSEIKNSTMDSREIPYGAKVTITAEQTSTSSDFYYWLNSSNERIISTSNTYEFTAVTNTSLTAQFTSYESLCEGKKLVIYVNNAKNVIKAFELADGDNYTVPAGPVLPDYTFEGWSMTKDQVLASDKDTVVVEPVYTLSAENTVTITQGNYTATGEGTYKAENNQRAVVTISTDAKDGDGNEFLYWIDADTNEIVSYDRTYSFFCVKDTVLTPVYGDASAVTVEPIVRITEVKYNALSGKVSFFAERSVPEEFTILQTGIVVTKTESIGTNEDVFVVGGTSTAAGTSTNTANNGYYSAATAVAAGQSVWARAYVIYETASGEILEAYGPVASYTVD